MKMKYLHTMVRVKNLEQSLDFYCKKLDLIELRRIEKEQDRFTLVFLSAPDDLEQTKLTKAPLLVLTYNWDTEDYTSGRNFGHLAYLVSDIYQKCEDLQKAGVIIHRPPCDGHMAFIKSPDNISIGILQQGDPLPIKEPWSSMKNSGETW